MATSSSSSPRAPGTPPQPGLRVQHVSNAAWALARVLPFLPPPGASLPFPAPAAASGVDSPPPPPIVSAADAAAALAPAVRAALPAASPQELANLAWSLASLAAAGKGSGAGAASPVFRPPPRLAAALADAVAGRAGEMADQELASALWGLARLGSGWTTEGGSGGGGSGDREWATTASSTTKAAATSPAALALLDAAAVEAGRRPAMHPRYAATCVWAVSRLGRAALARKGGDPGARPAVCALEAWAACLEEAAAPGSPSPPSPLDYAMALAALADARVRPARLPDPADAGVAAALRSAGGQFSRTDAGVSGLHHPPSPNTVAAVFYGCVALTGRATELEAALADAVGGGGRRGGRVAGRSPRPASARGEPGTTRPGAPQPPPLTPAASAFAGSATPTDRLRALWALAVLGDWSSPLYPALVAAVGADVRGSGGPQPPSSALLSLLAPAASIASAARAVPPLALPTRLAREVKRRLYADGGAGPGPRGAPARSAASALAALPGVETLPPRRLPGLGLDIPIPARLDATGELVALEVLGAGDLTRGAVRGPAGPARARRAALQALGYTVVALDGPRWASLGEGEEEGGARAAALRAVLGPRLLGGEAGGGDGVGEAEGGEWLA
jgi:hypothetical protein